MSVLLVLFLILMLGAIITAIVSLIHGQPYLVVAFIFLWLAIILLAIQTGFIHG